MTSSNPRHFEKASKSNVFALPQEPVQQNKIDSRSRFVQRIDNLWNNLGCQHRWRTSCPGSLAVWMKINYHESARICRNTVPKTNMTMENPLFEDVLMYFLSNIGIFQFHVSFQECITNCQDQKWMTWSNVRIRLSPTVYQLQWIGPPCQGTSIFEIQDIPFLILLMEEILHQLMW